LNGTILDWVEHVMSSPWIYTALILIAAVDSFLPVVPSETAVITAGVFAADDGKPNLILVIVSAALGAFAGDHVSYFIGRYAGGRLGDRIRNGKRRKAAVEWASRALTQRGGMILVAARYIPGGRTAVTLTCGIVGYPLRRFSPFDALGALTWALYSSLIGYVGGKAFEDNPIGGLLLGLGVALGVSAAIEVVTRLRHRRQARRRARQQPAQQPADVS
jgi:membrane-associated protein